MLLLTVFFLYLQPINQHEPTLRKAQRIITVKFDLNVISYEEKLVVKTLLINSFEWVENQKSDLGIISSEKFSK